MSQIFSPSDVSVWALGLALVLITAAAIWKLFKVNIPEIKGIPTIPGEKPIIGT
jgi:hypothetical protein